MWRTWLERDAVRVIRSSVRWWRKRQNPGPMLSGSSSWSLLQRCVSFVALSPVAVKWYSGLNVQRGTPHRWAPTLIGFLSIFKPPPRLCQRPCEGHILVLYWPAELLLLYTSPPRHQTGETPLHLPARGRPAFEAPLRVRPYLWREEIIM